MINTVLGTPLGFIIYIPYRLFDSYGLAILAFAVIVKAVLFPIMLVAHKNSIRLLRLQPELYILKQRYTGDALHEAQYDLFKREKYSPLVGLLPLLVQLFLIMGMLQVMYHPLQHMLRLDSQIIDTLVTTVRGMDGSSGGFAAQLNVLEAFQHPENWPAFREALSAYPNGYEVFAQIQGTNLHFLGLNLGATPSLAQPSIELIIILLSGLAALIFSLVQNAISPGAISQSRRTNYGLIIFTVCLSVYFAAVLPVGVGLYWTIGNLTAIGVVYLLNALLPPKKLAGDAIAHIQATRKTPEQLRQERVRNKGLKSREKADAARFAAAKKQLVFYALSGGQYRYYKNIIDYILAHSDATIHYLTNDPDDGVFKHDNDRIIPYYAGQRKTIGLMLRLNTDIMVTTVPDLQTFHMKRSIVRDDIEYIFIPHSMASLHVTMKEAACDHFNTILCVGQHQNNEVRRREALADLPRKKLVKAGYGLYDQLAESYQTLPQTRNEKLADDSRPKILIAPSWQQDNLLDLCIDPMLSSLIDQGYEIIIRPHPQYIRLFPSRMNALQERYANNGDITFVLDFADNTSVFTADLLITDWSNIAFEFAYCTLRPCVFINTPMKVMNPNYEQFGPEIEVVDIVLRDMVGVSVDPDDTDNLNQTVTQLLSNQGGYKEQIVQAKEKYLYHPGRNGEAGGKYIIQQLESRKQA